MYSTMGLGTRKIHVSPSVFQTQPAFTLGCSSLLPLEFPRHKCLHKLNIVTTQSFHFYRSPKAIFRDNSKPSVDSDNANVEKDDFVTRVLKENPSQVEPRYLIGDKLYSLREKENLDKKGLDSGVASLLKSLNLKSLVSRTSNKGQLSESQEDVYLKDILREYKGKLYVPEQIFGANLSEEEEFEKIVEELPKMGIEDFRKYMKSDKIKLLTFTESSGASYGYGFRDFVVELKEIPGDKSLQRTKW